MSFALFAYKCIFGLKSFIENALLYLLGWIAFEPLSKMNKFEWSIFICFVLFLWFIKSKFSVKTHNTKCMALMTGTLYFPFYFARMTHFKICAFPYRFKYFCWDPSSSDVMHISRRLDWKWRSQDLNQALWYGCKHPKWLMALCHALIPLDTFCNNFVCVYKWLL